MSDEDKTNPDSDTGTAVVEKTKVSKPRMYKILMHNDDYTTMEFVVYVLERLFKKSKQEAYEVMMRIHQQGIGICGVFTFEVAESKVSKVAQLAKREGHPLKCSIEPEE